MNILAIDTGFAQTKVYTGNVQKIFPTAVARPATIFCKDIPSGGSRQYTINGKTLVVGYDALKSEVSQDYNLEVEDHIGIIPYLIAAAADIAGVDLAAVNVVVLGLPITDFVKNKSRLLDVMRNYTVNGVTYTFQIQIEPQAIGALTAYAHESAVMAEDEEGVILDCGGNTLHVVGYRGDEAQRDGTKVYDKRGVAEAAKKVSVILQDRTGHQYSLPQTMEIMRKGFVKHCGKRIELSAEISKILAEHFEELVRQIQTDFRESFDSKDKLILAGGGAKLLKEHLPDIWQDMIFVIAEPEYANVRGYYYAAKGA